MIEPVQCIDCAFGTCGVRNLVPCSPCGSHLCHHYFAGYAWDLVVQHVRCGDAPGARQYACLLLQVALRDTPVGGDA